MNKDWSDRNKESLTLISKECTFCEGIAKLIALREELFLQITNMVSGLPKSAFWEMPFAGVNGNHSLSIGWSIYHLYRIEDIVTHQLISHTNQIFNEEWKQKIGSSIITTGNELCGQEIADFSKNLNIEHLYNYAKTVFDCTNRILCQMKYSDLKQKISQSDKQGLIDSGNVAKQESWLIDYWCDKNVLGLIKMPLSRHHIVHVEAMLRIKNRLCKIAGKGVDPIT